MCFCEWLRGDIEFLPKKTARETGCQSHLQRSEVLENRESDPAGVLHVDMFQPRGPILFVLSVRLPSIQQRKSILGSDFCQISNRIIATKARHRSR